MNKYSKNNKLNTVLTNIEADLLKLGIDEVNRYYKDFKNEIDYNIVQYGNLLVYFSDIYKFYANAEYKTTGKMSSYKIWEIYKRQVGYVTRQLINEYGI